MKPMLTCSQAKEISPEPQQSRLFLYCSDVHDCLLSFFIQSLNESLS